MNWKNIACTALAVPMLYAGVSSIKFSDVHAQNDLRTPKAQTIEQKVFEKDLIEPKSVFSEPRNCPAKVDKKPFYFDQFEYIPFENVDLDAKLHEFSNRHPSFHGNFFGFQNILMLPTRLLGKCDWWPKNLEWTWGVGNEAYFKDDDIRQLAWNLSTGLRLYTKPDQFFELGWQHWSFAKTRIEDTEEYMIKNKINLDDSAVRDIVFFRFADQVKLWDKTNIEYFIARSIWESNIEDIPRSFYEKDKRRPYQSTIGGFKANYSMGQQLDSSVKWEAEFSTSRSSPQRLEFAFNLFYDSKKDKGASLFYQRTKGVGDNSVNVGYHGLRMNGRAIGIKLFHKSW